MEDKYFPLDLLVIILAYLPVKSIVQFKSVCKFWKTIIEGNGFVETHRLTRAATNEDNCVLVRSKQWFSLLHRSETGVVKCVHLDLPVFMEKDVNKLGLSAPCNGVLYLGDGEHEILWNPAIRDFKLLPRSLNLTPAPPPNESVHLQTFCTGFGFNPLTDDYKVVRILTSKYGTGYIPGIFRAEIYSLKADSWRSIIFNPTISLKEYETGEVYLDGKYYWCFEQDISTCKLLCFDFVKEIFEVIDVPDSNSDGDYLGRLVVVKDFRTDDEFEEMDLPNGNHRNHWSKLILMKESLAMFSFVYSESHQYFNVWAMKVDGAVKSWHKFLTIGPFYQYDSPVGFWKDELFLQLEHADGPERIVSCDYITGEIKDTFTQLDVIELEPLGIYNESLVSVSAGLAHEE